ncbi:hypothetical protein QJS66_01270 [Kocuria rhizophila]|nr:hypothetical protein QJS66_01270 [Kocuria rhizophila]
MPNAELGHRRFDITRPCARRDPRLLGGRAQREQLPGRSGRPSGSSATSPRGVPGSPRRRLVIGGGVQNSEQFLPTRAAHAGGHRRPAQQRLASWRGPVGRRPAVLRPPSGHRPVD